MLMATQESWRFNPMHIGFELLAKAAGTRMLDLATSFSNPDVHIERVHGFGSAAGAVLRVFLINKMESRDDNSIPSDWFSGHLSGCLLDWFSGRKSGPHSKRLAQISE